MRGLSTKLAGSAALAALALSATACSGNGKPDYFGLTDAQAAHAYAATEWLPATVAYCGIPAGNSPLPVLPSALDAYRAGYCWAVTDEPTLALQRLADRGYTDRIAYAVAHGVKL